MSDCAPAQVVQHQVEAYNGRDLSAFIGYFAPDAALYDFPDKVFVKGSAELSASYGKTFSDARFMPVRIASRIVSGDYVIDEELVAAKGKLVAQAVAIYRVKDCKIVRVDFLPDQRLNTVKAEINR